MLCCWRVSTLYVVAIDMEVVWMGCTLGSHAVQHDGHDATSLAVSLPVLMQASAEIKISCEVSDDLIKELERMKKVSSYVGTPP